LSESRRDRCIEGVASAPQHVGTDIRGTRLRTNHYTFHDLHSLSVEGRAGGFSGA
jgi:hypothetical protein